MIDASSQIGRFVRKFLATNNRLGCRPIAKPYFVNENNHGSKSDSANTFCVRGGCTTLKLNSYHNFAKRYIVMFRGKIGMAFCV